MQSGSTYLTIEDFYIASSKHKEGVSKIHDGNKNLRIQLRVYLTFKNSPDPQVVTGRSGYVNVENHHLYCFKKTFYVATVFTVFMYSHVTHAY